ncbi:transposase-like protein [Bacilli bacterium PM5-3]|nr:transposase-like protein [Bacilli bacterium PM5-3]MDH6604324.1 transposase-like protein [Bacilli bacterium PM5-9]
MKDIIKKLNNEQMIELKDLIIDELFNSIEKESNNSTSIICPDCSSKQTVKNGKSPQGIQKYKCNDCGKTRVITRNKLTFSSKKKFSQWVRFIESLLAQDSLKVSCEKAKISKSTAFRWRIKVLNILTTLVNQDVLEGVIHLDETLVNKVLKDKNVPYISTKSKKRGMSDEKLSIACAIGDPNNVIIRVADVGRITSEALLNVYQDKIKEKSIVVSDSLRSYHKVMKLLNVDWKKIPSKKKSFEEYTLEPINSLHALIKDFLYYYKGISQKYLQGYLSLFEIRRRYKRYYQNDVFETIVKMIIGGIGHLRCEDIDNGNVIIA